MALLVLNKFATVEPPEEWQITVKKLSQMIGETYIDKIEVAAFAIRGKRTARWKVPTSHPEYATLENSLGAAKKLTWLLLNTPYKRSFEPSDPFNLLKIVFAF